MPGTRSKRAPKSMHRQHGHKAIKSFGKRRLIRKGKKSMHLRH